MKNESAPAGSPSTRARTTCTMFSNMSESPLVTVGLLPLIRYEPSRCGTATAFCRTTSLPACSSVAAIADPHFPETRLGRYLFFCSSDPSWSTHPVPEKGEAHSHRKPKLCTKSSNNGVHRDMGKPDPPYSWGT